MNVGVWNREEMFLLFQQDACVFFQLFRFVIEYKDMYIGVVFPMMRVKIGSGGLCIRHLHRIEEFWGEVNIVFQLVF